jgi:NAD(P)-dependent dehydrogenase (short-subunit alcohol dehydrogenase family)
MGLKKIIRKMAKLVLESSPEKNVQVKIDQIQYGKILNDYTIVVTGGSSGIGLSMAKKFVSEGAKVIISGRNENKLKKAIGDIGTGAQYVVNDVSNIKDVNHFLDECEKKLGRKIDCLVNNAGISLHEGNYKNVSEANFDLEFDTNLKGSYFLSQAFLERKNDSDHNQLLFISSETGSQVYDTPYGLTKAAINSLTGALSRREYQNGMRVNAIAPGVTVSNMTSDYVTSEDNLYMNNSADRVFLPEEVAEVACFLLSRASKCISGEVIHCNAGNHLKTFW